MDLIKLVEQEFATGTQHPEFIAGDTVTVGYKIKEGNKERIQSFRGVVIQVSGERFLIAIPQDRDNQSALGANRHADVEVMVLDEFITIHAGVDGRRGLERVNNRLDEE